MHTCDGCRYCNEDGSCSREYYPEFEQEKRKASNNDKWTITFCWIAIAVIITTIYIASLI